MSSPSFSAASVLQPLIDHHELAGAVALVADKDKILSLEAFGFADAAAKVPLTTDAFFWIASQTKPITATALMMLVDEGKVNVEDPIEKYLPEMANLMVQVENDEEHRLLKKPTQQVLVRHVLSHVGGFPFLTPVEWPLIDTLKLRDAGVLYSMVPLLSEPGTAYLYSNIGTNIAGRIIEVASGQSYESFMQDRLFGPLGMTDTTFWPNAEQIARLAKTHKPGPDNVGLEVTENTFFQQPLDGPGRYGTPGGGLFSSAKDVARFCQMILRGGEWDGVRYVSEASIEQMTSQQIPKELGDYGFCWQVQDGWFGHGGAYATNMIIDKRYGLLTVYLVQHAGFPGEGNTGLGRFRDAATEYFSGASVAPFAGLAATPSS